MRNPNKRAANHLGEADTAEAEEVEEEVEQTDKETDPTHLTTTRRRVKKSKVKESR
jgi:hypothetical protein